MSEMLGNQYFMARKFAASVPEFEEALAKTRDTKMIRKKLIICYTQVGQIQRAFQLFHSLIKEDIEFIANTDVIADDCPCPELVTNLSQQEATPENSMLPWNMPIFIPKTFINCLPAYPPTEAGSGTTGVDTSTTTSTGSLCHPMEEASPRANLPGP